MLHKNREGKDPFVNDLHDVDKRKKSKSYATAMASSGLPAENIKTNTQRGRPHMWTALLVDGRPRITGLLGSRLLKMLSSKKRNFEKRKRPQTYVRDGLILAAKCGENCLTVLVTFSLKVPAKLQ